MVRVIAGFPVILAISSMLSALTKAEQETGMTMQLHRLPKHDIHPERYARRLNIEEDAPELVPLHLGLGYDLIHSDSSLKLSSDDIVTDTERTTRGYMLVLRLSEPQ